MHLDRILSMCPFLLGSKEGIICKASGAGRTPCLSLSRKSTIIFNSANPKWGESFQIVSDLGFPLRS